MINIGDRNERIVAVSISHRIDSANVWLCKCDCGNFTKVRSNNFKRTKSCGCLIHKPAHNRTHNMGSHRLYRIWTDMKTRCYNKNRKVYKDYGGRGIVLCDEWKNDFMSFYNWSIENGYSEELTIDRINNNGNYEPSNCRWTTMKEQANNTRANIFVEINGIRKTLSQWCDVIGITQQTMQKRIKKYGIEKAVSMEKNSIKDTSCKSQKKAEIELYTGVE